MTTRIYSGRLLLTLALVLSMALTACSSGDTEGGDNGDAPSPSETSRQTVEGTGTIRFFDFEGGFYGIIADDSMRYDPGDSGQRPQHRAARQRVA